jgi:hypothetical protein
MLNRRTLILASLCTLALAAVSSAAASGSWQIRANASHQKLGDWRIDRNPTFGAAIDTFGSPDRCLPRSWDGSPGGKDALAVWNGRGFSLYATTLAYAEGPACQYPDQYQVDHVTVTGHRWTTSLGLHVGDGAARLHRLYPDAKLHRAPRGAAWTGYWLVTTRSYDFIADKKATMPTLVAKLNQGRVSALTFPIGAQGE